MLVTLQEAIYDALNGVISVDVYDSLPDNTPAPYVVIGDDTSIDWSTDNENGLECTITIHCWSTYRGRAEIKNIQQSVYNALHRATLALDGYDSVGCHFEFSESFIEADGVTRHGVQRFRIYARQQIGD
jgi:hypothetical protein